MCDFNQGFILCKCEPPLADSSKKKLRTKHKKKLAEQAKSFMEYEWILFKYIGPALEKEIGRYIFPVSETGEGLTADLVLNELNTRNCFDFEYNPLEGDNLVIKARDFSRLEFIYKNDQWTEDYYCDFDHVKEVIDRGKVKMPRQEN